MNNTFDLKPCPFCGGSASPYFDPEGVEDTMGRKWAYVITCNKCAASSGLCFSMEKAMEVWNRRARSDK